MKREILEPLYKCFDDFLSTYIISKDSFLTKDKRILQSNYLDKAIEYFVDNYDEGNSNFEEKIQNQFANASRESKLNFAHAEWLWYFSVGDISLRRKKDYLLRRLDLSDNDIIPSYLFPITFGHGGQWHTNNKYWEIVFVLYLISVLNAFQEVHTITDVQQLKDIIEEYCNYIKYDTELDKLKNYVHQIDKLKVREKKYAMSNILLYLANPNSYERIASDNHKNRIVNSFVALENEEDETKTIDDRIFSIRTKISELIKDIDFDFYEHSYIRRVWNTDNQDLDFDELQALLFKKSVVFYGPPGTSKTFKAKELAETYILSQYIKKRDRLEDYLTKPNEIVQKRIHHLQLHANYTYENFVGGYLLKNGDTVLTKGSFIKICDAARKDLNEIQNFDIPHVLILDEMNRVDLSKLFGETFSALEQRDYDISVGIEDLVLNIPRNLHIIGTMNEIDFSVEQIDFALRRRFLWFFYGYREESLKEIIYNRAKVANSKITEEDLVRFYQNIKELNDRISLIEDLGQMYQIGHAFFADIVSIYDQYYVMKEYKRSGNFLFKKNGPVQILWNISIKPILEAFMGNQDEGSKNQYLIELEAIFLK